MKKRPKPMRARRATPPRTPPTIGPMGVDFFEAGGAEVVGFGVMVVVTGVTGGFEVVMSGVGSAEDDEEDEPVLEITESVPVSTSGVKCPPNVWPS